MDCIFCKIISGDIPSEKVFENEKELAFKDITLLFLRNTLTELICSVTATLIS